MSFHENKISDYIISFLIPKINITWQGGAETQLYPPFRANRDEVLPVSSLNCLLPCDNIPFSGLSCLINGQTYHVSPGECLFFPSGVRRNFIRNDQGHRSIWVHLDITFGPNLNLLDFFKIPFVIKGPAAENCRKYMEKLNRDCKNILIHDKVKIISPRSNDDMLDLIEEKAYLLLLLKEILALSEPKEELFRLVDGFHNIEPAINLINNHGFSKISLDKMAEACFCSRSSFEKKFRMLMGISPGKYLLNLRLDKAMNLLLQSDMSCTQIAEQTGFANQFVFSRFFKKRFGVAPTRYRGRKILG